MLNNIIFRLKEIYRSDTRFFELYLSVHAVWWGFQIATFDMTKYPSMELFSELPVKISTVGFVFCIVGILQFTSLLSANQPGRRIAANCNVVLWTFVSAMIALSDYRDPPIIAAVMRVLGSVWLSFRIPPGKGLTEFLRKNRRDTKKEETNGVNRQIVLQ